MDEFDTAAKRETISAVERLDLDRRQIAVSRTALFSATLCRLLQSNREDYCAVVAAGTSGLYMMELAKAVFRILEIELPPTVCLPVIRFTESGALFDNSGLSTEVRRQLKDHDPLKRVLFIDDEIRRGTTAHACLKLISDCGFADGKAPLLCTIVAENHFFEWHWDLPGVAIRYFAPARLLYGLQHNIAHCLPSGLVTSAQPMLGTGYGHHELIALVLSGAVKRQGEKSGFFDETPAIRLSDQMPDFQSVRDAFQREFAGLVENGVREFLDGTIKFRF
jgi:hypothetical protein